MWFYVGFVVFTFMAVCLLLGVVLFVSDIIDKGGKPVDGGCGTIVGRHWQEFGHGNKQESYLAYVVECTIDGFGYRQEATRSSKKIYISKKELAENNNKEVEIRYYRKKSGKVILRIYEPAITLGKALIFSLVGATGIIGQILLILSTL